MSFDSHESPMTTAISPDSPSGVDSESLGGSVEDADVGLESEFPFGGASMSEEDVVELELFHPDEDLDAPPASRGTLPATIAAVLLHVWLLATLNNLIRTEPAVLSAEPLAAAIKEAETPPPKPEKEEDPEYSLANPDDREFEIQKVLNATSIGIARSKKPQLFSPPDPPLKEIDPKLTRREVFDIPEGVILDETLVVKGTTGNAIVQIEAALDRVTHEIAMNLKERKVLLIWLIDASASLKAQRGVIAKRLKRIYGELDALGKAGQIPRLQTPLLTTVASFGDRTNFLTPAPTAKFDDILAAIKNVKIDETGRENVFTAVFQVLKRWGKDGIGRRVMIVTVTDESGDDFPMLEMAIARCRRYAAKAYVIGPAAAFGRRKGYVPYVAPENGKTYQIPVDLGPETARYENTLLPFWFEGPQYTYLSSGYGPYGLSRLVKETGGIYFTTNTLTMTGLTRLGTFDSETLKPFEPDYRFGTPEQYDRDLAKHPLRFAIVQAAKYSRDNKPEGTPAMDLRVTPQNFRRIAATAQQTVARSDLMAREILKAFPKGVEREFLKEQSPRWRMTFCLTYGRLLALRVRCLEYGYACANLGTTLTPQDVGSTANHWIFRPSEKINFATGQRRMAKTAVMLLQRVIDEAPGTPWAVLAARELRHPLGIRVIKRFIPPPTPRPRRTTNTTPRRRILLAREPRKPRPRRKPAPKPKPPKLPRY